MPRIPAVSSLREGSVRCFAKLIIEIRARIESGARAGGRTQQTVIMRSLMIRSYAVWLTQLNPLEATGGTNLHPARLACHTQRRPRR